MLKTALAVALLCASRSPQKPVPVPFPAFRPAMSCDPARKEPIKAQCDAIGLAIVGGLPTPGDAASAAIAGALLAWKNDPLFALTIQEYYNSFMDRASDQITFNAMPHSLSTSQLVLMGGGLYGLKRLIVRGA